ncbi:MAG TPA: uracil-DNA glycosylase family protein [Longimicrobiales bacterium]|nr:uracil-DNA glycosylase family protein [Longimicrobiales bacterium]
MSEPCRAAPARPAARPLVWSRRNGAWRRVSVLWVGAAPGNAGGLGTGTLGAHATRIPFGGDIAGGNLDVLLSTIGLSRNDTFIIAALNQLPARGGGEPAVAEIAAPVGRYPDSIALLRDTVVAAGPALVVALGNVALRTLAAALTRAGGAVRLPGQGRLSEAGLARDTPTRWPLAALPMAMDVRDAWADAWGDEPDFHVLPLLHPSAQNMSPFAGVHTAFHERMLRTRDALAAAVRSVLDWELPRRRPDPPRVGVYDLPEWRERIAPAHARYDALWRRHGV